MNTAIWVTQVIVAMVFLIVGLNKTFRSRDALMPIMPYVEDFTPTQVRLIGILEILAVLGILLPSITGILPWLTPLAALGLMLVMLGAIYTHLRRGNEGQRIMVNVVLFLLSAFILYGRAVAEKL